MLSALRQFVLSSARAWPLARHAHARLRKRRYEGRVQRFITERTGRADRLPIRPRLRGHHALQPHLRVLLRRRPPQPRRRVAPGNDPGESAPRLPARRAAGQPDRRRDLHAEGHHVRPRSLQGQGLLLRLSDHQRHDHQRRASRRPARPSRSRDSSSTSASRSTARASCTTRRAA